MNVAKKLGVLLAGVLVAASASGIAYAAEGLIKPKQSVYTDKILERGRIVIGVKFDVPDYAYQNPRSGELEGFEIDLAKELTKELMGDVANVEFRQTVSSSRIPMLQNGAVDLVLATMTQTRERMQQIDFTNVYYVAGQVLLVPEASQLKRIDDITTTRIAAAKGGTSEKVARQRFPQAELLLLDGHAETLEALTSSRADALLGDDTIVVGMQKKVRGYRVLPGQLTFEPYAMGVAKGNDELLKSVNSALSKIKADGRWAAIYKKNLDKEAAPPADQPEDRWLQ